MLKISFKFMTKKTHGQKTHGQKTHGHTILSSHMSNGIVVNPFALRKAKIIYSLAFLSAERLSKTRRVPKYLREQRNSRERKMK